MSAQTDKDGARKVAASAPPTFATRTTIAVEAFAERVSRFVVGHRILVIVLAAMVTAALGYGLRYLHDAADARVFFGEHNPELVVLKELENTYSRSNSIFFIITAKSGDLFTADGLRAIAEMTEDAWQTPFVLRTDSIANFQTVKADGDDIAVAPLYTADEALTDDRLAEIKRSVLSEEELSGGLISADGAVTGISVLAVLPRDDMEAVPTVAGFARDLAEKWRAKWPSLEVRITGGIIADMTFSEAGDRDLRTLVPIMTLLLLVTLAIGFRSIGATLVVMTVTGASVVAGLGAAVWFGATINAGTGSSPIAIMVLTVATAVHVLVSWIAAGAGGKTSREAIIEATKLNFAAVCVTNITTVIGYLSLNFSDSPPLRELGNIVAVGTLVAGGLSLTLLPALISFVRVPPPTVLTAASGLLTRIGAFVTRHPLKLVVSFVLVSLLLGVGATRLVLDDNYINYFSEDFEFRRDTDYAQQHLSGLNAIEFSLNSGSAGGVFDPAFLDRVDRFATWLGAQPNVGSVDSLVPLIKRLNRAVHDDDPAASEIGATREENAQTFLLYELSLPVGHELTTWIDINREKTLLTAIVKGGSSRDIRDLATRAEEWLRANTPEIAAPASGLSVVFAYVSERNIGGMLTGTLLSFLICSAIMLVAFQNVRIGLLSLVPNILPCLQAFGIWGLAVGQVNLAATVVTSMTFGIIIDDTTHVTLKYLRNRRILGEAPDVAARHAVRLVGFPVFLTTLAIGSGFAVIALSDFQLSQYLGGLSLLIISLALVADLFLLLPLLMMIDRVRP